MKNVYKVNEDAVKKIAERVYDNGSTVINKNDLEEMFPELKKESEDERIRKAIKLMYSFLPNKPNYIGDVSVEDVFAWLEKQGEKPTWSEEDEQYLEDTLNLLEGHRSKNTYGEVKKWLKFLKERYSWKPSEKHMKWLHDAIESTQYEPRKQALISLYSDLMKLTE